MEKKSRLTDLSYIRELLSGEDTGAKKRFGQNFLINEAIPRRIAYEGCEENSAVLEIGPGLGTLTVELAARAKKVVAVEIDPDMVSILETTLAGCDNVKVIRGDILKCDLNALIKEEFAGYDDIRVCANLPYYVTTPVLMFLLESGIAFKSITVMVQKEVADRLTAEAGSAEYGAITASIAYHGRAEKLFSVAAGNFFPAPKVESCVLRINCYDEPPYKVADEATLFRCIKAAFAFRRKTLANALSSEFAYLDKAAATDVIVRSGLASDVRGEKLSIAQFAFLSDNVFETRKNSKK